MVKKLSFLLMLISLGYTTNAQQASLEVLPVQNTLITKISATWCINCGTWAWDAHEKIIEENVENAIHFNAHYSGDLESEVARAFSRNFGSIGQPQFFLNNDNVRLFSSNQAAKREEIAAAVSANAMKMPVAATASLHEFEEELLTIQTKAQFFQNTTGEYYLATYLIEDGVMNFQTGPEKVVPHKSVMRGGITENPFGDPIATGAVHEELQLFTLPEDWNPANIEIVTIIWKKEGDTYLFVNATTSSLKMESEEGPEIPIDPNPDPEPPTMGEAPDFPEFPWLQDLIDPSNCCDNSSIKVYNSGIFQYVHIDGEESCSENMGTLYFQDGTFYCADSPNMDCRTAYGLTEQAIAKTWDCSGTTEEMEEMEDTETPTEPTSPNFEEFPWLSDLVNTTDCCNNQKVIAYYSGIFTYIYIESNESCGTTVSQLYFQDGTFYCSDANGMDCRGAYGLSSDRSSVLWDCSSSIEESEEMEDTENTDTPTESTAPNFEEYPWLNELINTDDCCNNQRVTAYESGIFTFIYIEADESCGTTASQLYFENGTFYCSEINGLDCVGAYGLSADQSTVLWECAN